jgi:hypothetical protein
MSDERENKQKKHTPSSPGEIFYIICRIMELNVRFGAITTKEPTY